MSKLNKLTSIIIKSKKKWASYRNLGAMFGLEDRALRKQSGRLFLVRLRRLTSKRLVAGQQARCNMFSNIIRQLTNRSKTAAMFGLDARIALIIVSVLGLIVYPNVSHIINNTKAEAILANLKIVDKAVIQYIDDIGSYPNSVANLYNKKPTKASQASRWKGPYLNSNSTDQFIPTNFTWAKVNSNCNTSVVNHGYCDMILTVTFSNISNSIYKRLSDFYPVDNYDINTKSLDLVTGSSLNKTSTKIYTYKVRELP